MKNTTALWSMLLIASLLMTISLGIGHLVSNESSELLMLFTGISVGIFINTISLAGYDYFIGDSTPKEMKQNEPE